jgi:hypothetical protein
MPNLFARDRSRLAAFLLAMAVAFAGTDLAYGQEADADSTAPPATQGQWAVGGQLSPLFGASLRWAATPRVTVQVTGAPGLGSNIHGTLGARGLYQFVVRPQYNVYGGVGGAGYVRRDLDLRSSGTTVQTEVSEVVTAVIGAEVAIGDHFGLSAEGGIGYMWWDEDEGEVWTIPSFGVGLHYYWR